MRRNFMRDGGEIVFAWPDMAAASGFSIRAGWFDAAWKHSGLHYRKWMNVRIFGARLGPLGIAVTIVKKS